jgi:protein TonB
MTRAQAAVLPLSVSAHAAGVAGLLALSMMPAALPAARVTPAPPLFKPPIVDMPVLRDPVRGGSQPPRGSGPRPRSVPPRPSEPVGPAPALVDPPTVPFVEGPLAEGEPVEISEGIGCIGCEIGNATPMGRGPGGAGDASGGTPVRLGGLIREPVKLRHVPPVYPEIARAARVHGLVVLECTLTPEGHVADIRVVSGHPLLAPAARRAVEQWLYKPTLLNGVPVPVIMTVTVKFELR